MISKSFGPVTISESAGVVSIAANLPAVAGAVAGSVQVNLSALQLLDAAMLMLEAKFPSLAAEIALVKSAIDSEAAKV